MKIERCKGTYDLLPEDMEKFRHIVETFRPCCIEKGYREIKTPTLEYLYLFSSTGTLTPGKLQKVYSFLDWNGWSGERVVLRPDATIPAARLYVENSKKFNVARLFYIQNVFSFEESGDVSREQWQYGVEAMGSDSAGVDLELIMLAQELLKKLSIESELQLSHVGVMKALIDILEEDREKKIELLDKVLDGNEVILPTLIAQNPKLEAILPVINTIGTSSGYLKNLKAYFTGRSESLDASLADFINLCTLLEKVGCKFKINLKSTRGFEYYTGIIFQLRHGDVRLGGGGRYNDLVPLIGGGNVPASGFAIYLDRVMATSEVGSVLEKEEKLLVICPPLEGKINTGCFQLAEEFREAGYIAEICFEEEHIKQGVWVFVVRGDSSSFTLINNNTGSVWQLSSVREAIEIIERER